MQPKPSQDPAASAGAGADVNETTDQKRSSLLYACSKGRNNLVNILINAGADVNSVDNIGATPLHRAVG